MIFIKQEILIFILQIFVDEYIKTAGSCDARYYTDKLANLGMPH